MGQQWYYDFMNMNDALSRSLIKNGYLSSLHYIKDFASLKVSEFRYKNIEKIPNLTSDILEACIMFNYCLCFYNVKGIGWVLCRYVYGGDFNEYVRPVSVNLIALNGKALANNVPYNDIILVKDNSMDVIPFVCMIEYINKIDMIDTSVLRCSKVASLPLVVSSNKRTANNANATAKKLYGDDMFIIGDDHITNDVKTFNIDVPISPLDLYELKSKYKNELLASLGIYSVEEKKERKIVSEVASQNNYVDGIYQDMLNQRKAFVEALNKADPSLGIELIESRQEIIDTSIENDGARAKATETGGNDNDTDN